MKNQTIPKKNEAVGRLIANLKKIQADSDNYLNRFTELLDHIDELPEQTHTQKSFKKAMTGLCAFHIVLGYNIKSVKISPEA
jgi:hypothetical protein